jgi:hypothetical protein
MIATSYSSSCAVSTFSEKSTRPRSRTDPTRDRAAAPAPARSPAPNGTRDSGTAAKWRPELYRARHRLFRARERLAERARCGSEPFARDPIIAEAWALKGTLRAVYRAASHQTPSPLDRFLAAVERSSRGASSSRRLWRTPSANGWN